ncbi:MAG TPA: hypothetical protein VEL76_10720, partial [Gemmataceae bacterium]|nr:hypothetical protein [Gemmataceae bacterium]
MFGELPHSKSSWNVWAQVAGQPKNSLDTAKGILDSLAHFNQCQSPTRLSGLDWLGQRFENSPGLAEEVLNHSDFKEFRTPFGETPGPRLLARV